MNRAETQGEGQIVAGRLDYGPFIFHFYIEPRLI